MFTLKFGMNIILCNFYIVVTLTEEIVKIAENMDVVVQYTMYYPVHWFIVVSTDPCHWYSMIPVDHFSGSVCYLATRR